MTAAAVGADDRNAASSRKQTPLATNDAGTRTVGGNRRAARPFAATNRIDTADVTISMAGRAARSSELNSSASRVARPLTNWAVTAAAHSIAVERTVRLDRDVICWLTRHPARNPAARNHGWARRTVGGRLN